MAVALSIGMLLVHLGFVVRVLSGPSRAPASRSTWVLALLLFPVGGVVAYLMFGERYMPRKKRLAGEAALARATRAADAALTRAGVVKVPTYEPARSIATLLHRSCGLPPVMGNQSQLMADADAAMATLAADIDAAQESVHLGFYIWLADHNGLRIKDAVMRAARRGVTCRVMADAIGSRAFIASPHCQDLSDAGVHLVRTLHESMIAWGFGAGRIDLRDHRKIMVIDNRITFVGSQNCADAAFEIKPRFAPWVDILVRFEGPVAIQMQALFLSGWQASTGEDLSAMLAVPEAAAVLDPGADVGIMVQGMGCGPFDTHQIMSNLFVSIIYAARETLCITTPYFVPDGAILAAIAAAARRGVATELILPERNDSAIVRAISQSDYPALIGAGVRIYEYRGGLLHAKTMTVDGKIALIGSANMDRRSLELNFENNVVIYDPALTATIRHRQQSYLDQSVLIDTAAIARWPLYQRVWQNAASIIGPVF